MNNQLSPISWQVIFKKSAVWGVWLFLLAIIQTSFFSVFRIFGAVPDLVLPAVLTIAIYDRERAGIIAAISGGYIADALGAVGLSLSPLIYMLCACAAALLAYSVLRRDFLSWLICLTFSSIISLSASLISAFALTGSAAFSFGHVFTRLILPGFFASIIMGAPVYFLTKLIWLRFFDNREMEG
ncbi:MAG: hypothetical protein IJ303_01300 [Clostridia bacterium]|nr:hypothetical protein [Clostridia bacterium]